jgi:Domain of unknown function (DUF5060)
VNRREMLQLGAGVAWSAYSSAALGKASDEQPQKQVETWDTYEVELHGPSTGNPFTEVTVSGRFHLEHRTVEVTGFYDGDGVYRIRFMPDAPGQWTWECVSSHSQLQGAKGSFSACRLRAQTMVR